MMIITTLPTHMQDCGEYVSVTIFPWMRKYLSFTFFELDISLSEFKIKHFRAWIECFYYQKCGKLQLLHELL